ncbi:YheV family putative zinc ribbon protein [Porticoccus sp.]
MFNKERRFIAGAVCPRCNQMDKIVVFTEDDKDYRACVSCDFKEQMFLQSTPRELETRVNRTAEEKQAEVQPVKLIDPGK